MAMASHWWGPTTLSNLVVVMQSWSNFFDGVLDDIGLWNRSLTEAEIQGLLSAPFTAVGCTDPEACNYDPSDNGRWKLFSVSADLLDSEIIARRFADFDGNPGLDTYLWNTGETTQSIVIENPDSIQSPVR